MPQLTGRLHLLHMLLRALSPAWLVFVLRCCGCCLLAGDNGGGQVAVAAVPTSPKALGIDPPLLRGSCPDRCPNLRPMLPLGGLRTHHGGHCLLGAAAAHAAVGSAAQGRRAAALVALVRRLLLLRSLLSLS